MKPISPAGGATSPRRRTALRNFSAARGESMQPTDIVGLAHVVLGAIGFVGAGIAFLFSGPAPGVALVLAVLMLIGPALTVLAGLWLRDGQRRGATLAVVVDVSRIALLAITGALFSLSTALIAAMLIGAVWLWPTLEAKKG
jgi:predicted benzoate:H+ symporter BenE